MKMLGSWRQDGDRWRATPVLAVTVLLVAFAAALAGCGGSSDNSTGTGDQSALTAPSGDGAQLGSAEVPEVTLGFVGEDVSLNTLSAPTVPNVSLMANVMQSMLAYTPEGELEPSLAESWKEVSPTEYLYTLREGARFSTGAPVTIDDVLYSLQYQMAPETGAVTSSYYLTVKSIEKVGSNQIRVKLKKPEPVWPYKSGHYPTWIFEKKALVAAGENLGGPQGIPVGSGPYAISELTNDHITFVRNEFYDGPKPPVAKFVVRLIADAGTSLAAMQSGDINGAVYVPPQSTKQWEAIQNVTLFSSPSPAYDVLWFNTSKAPFDDPHVRRALIYAFDREAVTENVLHGNATVYPTQLAPDMWASVMSVAEAEERAGEMGREYPFDVEKAKQELAQSKYADGFSVTASYPSSAPEVGLALQAMAGGLKELNVELEVREMGDTPFYDKLFEGEYEMAGGVASRDYPDPMSAFYLALCGCAIPPDGFNAARFDDPKLDRLFEEGFAEPNKAARADKVVEVMNVITEEVPFPQLWGVNAVTALDSGLTITDLNTWTFLDTPWMAKIGEPAAG